MANTTNFGWETPDDTDLVKDGAAAMRTLGNAIDTSLVDLKGGTTGQILSKASNTDLDYTWVSPNPGDITAVNAGTGISGGGTSGDVTITNSMATTIDAKGDLIVGTGNDAFGRLAAGSNGQTLVADSSQTTGLAWSNNFAAGKNKIINGDFGIWQRGTSFSNVSGYNADRFFSSWDGSGGTRTISQQTFTPGTAPVANYEGQFFWRFNKSVGGTSGTIDYILQQKIEDCRTFAGQTVTLSFWAKSDATRTINAYLQQNLGTGGSGSPVGQGFTAFSLTTSWQRFSMTVTMPSLAGMTIGTSSNLLASIYWSNTNLTGIIDIWGVQLEAGSVATAFQTATGTIQGELAACQRYLPVALTTVYDPVYGFAQSTTATYVNIQFKVPARVAPTGISVSSASHFQVLNKGLTAGTPTGITFDTAGVNSASIYATTTAGSPTIAAGEGGLLRSVNASGLILFTGCEL